LRETTGTILTEDSAVLRRNLQPSSCTKLQLGGGLRICQILEPRFHRDSTAGNFSSD